MLCRDRSAWSIARALSVVPLFLTLTGASSPSMTDVNESGRVLATLNDWRAITFVLLTIIFFQLIERLVTALRHARAQDRAYTIVERASAQDATMAEAFRSMTASMSRLESALVRRGEEL